MEQINYKFLLESQGDRLERTNKRLFIIIILLLVSLVGTNLGWICYENQFIDSLSVEQEVDTGNGDAFVTGIGDLHYGESKAEDHQNED